MDDLIKKVKALINVLSDDPNDYPDMSSFRQVMERSEALQEEVDRWETDNWQEQKRLDLD